jgi:hypothetical protein
MKDWTIQVAERTSRKVGFADLIVRVGSVTGSKCKVLVGCPSLPEIVQEMGAGDAIIYEIPGDGVFEVKVTSISSGKLGFLVTQS